MNDFLAIGETTIDAFIRLGKEAHAVLDKDKGTVSLPAAAKVPFESAIEIPAVANASNAAVAARRLGLPSALVANVGSDTNGAKCIERLKQEGVSTKFVKAHDGLETNYHYVLWYEDERTILQKHSHFPYTLPKMAAPAWLYLTSLGENSLPLHMEIAAFLREHPETKLAFQPGIFQITFGVEALKEIYARTDIFFCNVEEAGEILGMQTLGVNELLKRVHALGPKTVVITDGPKGAYAFDGKETYTQLPYPDPKPPLERTGAGDAFSSTTVAALALGHDLPTALKWGAVNSMSVVQYVGAQKGLLNKEKIAEYIKSAPAGF